MSTFPPARAQVHSSFAPSRMASSWEKSTGCGSARERLKEAWEKVLFHQFHDILAGCSIQEAYGDALNALGAAQDMGWEITQEALHRISWKVRTTRGLSQTPCQKNALVLWEKEGEGAPVLVFNPHSFPLNLPVQLNTTVAGVCDAQGRPVPCQLVRGPQTNFEDRTNTLLEAQVPAYGYALFYVFKDQAFNAKVDHPAKGEGYTLENQFLKVEFDPFTGAILSFYDKEHGRELSGGPMAKALVIDDQLPDTWAHGLTVFDQVVGQLGQAQVTLVEQGPLRAAIRVTTGYQNTTLRQDFRLAAHSRELEVSCRLDMGEQLKLLKLSFPLRAKDPKALYSLPYGFEEHSLSREEFPAHKWVMAFSEDGAGLSLCNDGKYSFSILSHPQGAELRMTIARGCIYADHYGVRDQLVEYQDQGEQFFRYTLSPDTDPASTVRRANLLNMSPELVLETHHQGSLEPVYQGADLEGENLVLSAAKEAEDGQGVILRLYETGGRPYHGRMCLPLLGMETELSLGAQEIKTLRADPSTGKVEECLITEL